MHGFQWLAIKKYGGNSHVQTHYIRTRPKVCRHSISVFMEDRKKSNKKSLSFTPM